VRTDNEMTLIKGRRSWLGLLTWDICEKMFQITDEETTPKPVNKDVEISYRTNVTDHFATQDTPYR